MAYKTPGVYIVEKNAFPNSVVEVETAVPAFIGYTEKAINKGNTLHNKPWRITSLSQFIEYFGAGPTNVFKLGESLATEAVGDKPAVPAPPGDFSVPLGGGKKKDYLLTLSSGRHLLYSSMQLFFQNGGGPCYIVSVGDYDTALSETALSLGVLQLKKELEPTMVVVPEAAVLSNAADCIKLQQAVLQHCGVEMKNRFAILDVHGGYLDRSNDPDPIDAFRDDLGTNSLNFGAAYYPWLDTSIVPESELGYLNVEPGEGITTLKALLVADMKLEVAPEGGIPKKNYDEKKRAVDFIDNKWLVAKTVDGKMALLTPNEFAAAQVASTEDKAAFTSYTDMVAKIKDATDATARAALLNDDQMAQAKEMVAKANLAVHQLLAKFSPLYNTLLRTMAFKLNRLPPSAAIAGLYTSVDNARGVWKAPANVSLNSVISPAVNLSHEEQEDLNVTTGGKSINAIRSFIGAGVLVWGARTLDGNSLDWRYVNVRRTMIMLEESLRLAMAAYVFEPNVSNTWLTVKSMASNFLTGIWKRGGLAGATAADAFSVMVGLGETMTAEDLLEGRMNVTILVALSRPAEFIEITFQQQMQKS